MAIITICGAGMMGSAMAFPATANGNTIRLVGTPLDREIIEYGKKTRRKRRYRIFVFTHGIKIDGSSIFLVSDR